MKYFVYILHSSKLDKYYVGYTDDVARRIEEHNAGRGNYTRKGIPWVLKHTESFATQKAAMRRELQIKKRKSRKYIESLFST